MGLLPREGKFFDFFNEHAHLAVKASVEVEAPLGNLSELERHTRTIEKNAIASG
jgi:hypothetical protein